MLPHVSSPLASGDAHTPVIASNNFKEHNDKVSSHDEFLNGPIEMYAGPFASFVWGCVAFGLSFAQSVVRG